ncbi:MAG: hypothetical protein HY529_01955, partial [Chloroflexi bacterium]|nr:hypothetical protein [Chloroflexota bacterium]
MPYEAEQENPRGSIVRDADAVPTSVGKRGQRGHRAFADLSQGSIPRHTFRLAWPQVTEQTLNILDNLVDMFWAGRLPGGFRSVAGLGVAQTFARVAFDGRMGMEQGTRAMVSRAVGAGNVPLANRIALMAFVISGVYSLIMVLVGLFLTDIALDAVGVSQAIHNEAAWYMRIQFMGMISTAFRMTSASTLQASGDVLIPLRATTVARVIHAATSPFFMFGWVGFPEMGLAGAAMANLLGQTAGTLIQLFMLFSGRTRLHLTLRGFR